MYDPSWIDLFSKRAENNLIRIIQSASMEIAKDFIWMRMTIESLAELIEVPKSQSSSERSRFCSWIMTSKVKGLITEQERFLLVKLYDNIHDM